VPSGIEERFEVDAGAAEVFSYLRDVSRVARCLPGAALDPADGTGAVTVRFTVPVGTALMSCEGRARLDSGPGERELTLHVEGTETGGSGSVTMKLVNRVEESPGGGDVVLLADVQLHSDVHASATLDAAARQLVERVADCMFRALAGPPMNNAPRHDPGANTESPVPQSPVAAASLQITQFDLPAARAVPPPDASIGVPQLQRTASIPSMPRPSPPRGTSGPRTPTPSPTPPARESDARGGFLAAVGRAIARLFGGGR
jgi:carbon monoxide dehydrogenase subunit G